MKKKIMARFPALHLKTKLILVFAFMTLIPTVSLVLVSHFIIMQSINRWESLSAKLRDISVLPIGDKALEIASDSSFISTLERGMELTEVDFGLPEDYVVMVYDTAGKLLLSTGGKLIPEVKLDSLESAGLPSIYNFKSREPVTTTEIKMKNQDLVLSAVMCQSLEDGRALGIVAVGQLIPSASAGIGSQTVIAALLLTAIFIFLIALWISSLIAREITEPIQKLVAGTQIVANGNLDYQVNIQARDEVGILADSFDQMTIKLRSNAEELKRIEKTAAWQEIAQKLAHEIKNPLTPIQLSAERLRRRYYSKREGYDQILDECIDTIINEVARVRGLLDEFSRLGRMPIAKPLPSDLNSIVEKAIKLYGEFPASVEVKTEYARDLPSALVDPEQMKQALFNIIKNAIEAMGDCGKLTVSTRIVPGRASIQSVSTIDSHIEVEFTDTGPGIPADSMTKLFTPHFSTKPGGTGLGLAIVKKIITDHGGDVTVKSEEGKGTVFTFMIPIAEGA